MSWPDIPDVRPLDEWHRLVVARGRRLRRVRLGVTATVATAAIAGAIAVPTVVLSTSSNGLDRLRTVTPASSPTPGGTASGRSTRTRSPSRR